MSSHSHPAITGTGVRLIADFSFGYRIVTKTYGQMNPQPRLAGDDPARWNRYDTPGSTIYLAGTEEIAFAEMLSSFALRLGQTHPLQNDADFSAWGWRTICEVAGFLPTTIHAPGTAQGHDESGDLPRGNHSGWSHTWYQDGRGGPFRIMHQTGQCGSGGPVMISSPGLTVVWVGMLVMRN